MSASPSATPFSVQPFTDDSFFEAIRSEFASAAQAAAQRRCRYLCEYLKAIGARTMVVEHEYTDGAYLDDFANYYVKSFKDYERRCRRLHFFGRPLTLEEVRTLVLGDDFQDSLQASYLGFVVARPLPKSIVGRTALTTYPDEGGRRNYPVTLEYAANLLGTPLRVTSLAFQEQDTVLAACATVALWSAFQKCADLFGTIAPSPAEITRLASTTGSIARTLPSRNLTLAQVCRAVQGVGLEPEVFECTATLPLSSLIYSYLRAGIPVVLLVGVGSANHAITVNGYSLRTGRQVVREDMVATSPSLHRIGLRIDEFYAHDDQVGPFSRLKVKTRGVKGSKDESVVYLYGDWLADDGKVIDIDPNYVIVPVYHKIRVSFVDIQRWITEFNAVAAQLIRDYDPIEWDVRLTTVNDFKAAMRHLAPAASREEILLGRFPRFLWRAILGTPSHPVAELVFDATDMERSYQFMDAVFYDESFRQNLRLVLHAADPTMQTALRKMMTPQFLSFLVDQTD